MPASRSVPDRVSSVNSKPRDLYQLSSTTSHVNTKWNQPKKTWTLPQSTEKYRSCQKEQQICLNARGLYLQPLIPPKRFDISPPITGGCSEGLGVFWFFFKQISWVIKEQPINRKPWAYGRWKLSSCLPCSWIEPAFESVNSHSIQRDLQGAV